MLEAAHQLCPTDPQACHEMGVLAYKAGQYASAVTWLRRALHLAPKVQVGGQYPIHLIHSLSSSPRHQDDSHTRARLKLASGVTPLCRITSQHKPST
jgi:hypothetical protein